MVPSAEQVAHVLVGSKRRFISCDTGGAFFSPIPSGIGSLVSAIPHGDVVQATEVDMKVMTKEAIRREKHKNVEVKRRQRMSYLFDQLKDLLQCRASDKCSILSCVLDTLKSSKHDKDTSADDNICIDHANIIEHLPKPVLVLSATDLSPLQCNLSMTREFGYSINDLQVLTHLTPKFPPIIEKNYEELENLMEKCSQGRFDNFRINVDIRLMGGGSKPSMIMGFSSRSPDSNYITLLFN